MTQATFDSSAIPGQGSGTISPPPTLVSKTTQVETTTINPTYFQPWGAGLLVVDRFFAQEYLGAIVPTDSQVPVYVNDDLTAGYEVYRGPRNARLTSVTPFVGAQALLPVSDSSSSDQLFLSTGLGLRLGQKLLLSGSYVTPVVGPKAFEGGATMGMNFFF